MSAVLYCDGVTWSPIKPYSTWTIVVPLPGAWMYLASPRASPSWTSSTGQEYTQAAGQRSVVHEQDEGIGFTDLLRTIRKVYRYRMHSLFSFVPCSIRWASPGHILTYLLTLTIVHFDGTPILSLHNIDWAVTCYGLCRSLVAYWLGARRFMDPYGSFTDT